MSIPYLAEWPISPKSFIARLSGVIGWKMTNLLIFKRGKSNLSKDNFDSLKMTNLLIDEKGSGGRIQVG